MLGHRLAGSLMKVVTVSSLFALAACGGSAGNAPLDGAADRPRDGSSNQGGTGGHGTGGAASGGSDGGAGGALGTGGGTGGELDGGGGAGAGGSVGTGGDLGAGGAGAGGTGGAGDSGTIGSGGQVGTGGDSDAGADAPSDGGSDQPIGAIDGTPCLTNADCRDGFCTDGVCCDTACLGACYTCAAATSVGTCVPALPGTDPDNDCDDMAATSCGTDGLCDGAGACRLYAAGTVCAAASCTGAATPIAAVVSTCDGTGTCSAGAMRSCGSFLCDAPGVACRAVCASDADCTATAFCSAGACLARQGNLAGNGDVEYGATNGWSNGGGGTLVINNATTVGSVHSGQYSIADTLRTMNFHGPSYGLPTGPGKYVISGWGMQNQDPAFNGALQINLTCSTASTFPSVAYNVSMPSGVWTQFSATIDTSTVADCLPTAATPGVVKSATLYLNQVGTATPVAFPDLYLDDVVVQVTDGHNLVGNPNFESGVTNGWGTNAGTGPVVSNSATIAHTGTHSLAVTGRTGTSNGPRYNLPLGAAKYNFSFWVLHTGTATHDLVLQTTYTCLGGTSQFPASVATATAVAGNTWTLLSGTAALPPPAAAAGCRLTAAGVYVQQEQGTCGTGAGQIECPDIYLDDASITLTP